VSKHWQPLIPLVDLTEGSCKGFDLQHNGKTLEIFAIHKNGKQHVYRNQCPHLGIRLEWQADQFLDVEGHFIQCATHGALFEIKDGLCIAGPCIGHPLEMLDSDIRNGVLGVMLQGVR
jgi:nitrite reductase/ring-hydroxylating ferredoxin subunit